MNLVFNQRIGMNEKLFGELMMNYHAWCCALDLNHDEHRNQLEVWMIEEIKKAWGNDATGNIIRKDRYVVFSHGNKRQRTFPWVWAPVRRPSEYFPALSSALLRTSGMVNQP